MKRYATIARLIILLPDSWPMDWIHYQYIHKCNFDRNDSAWEEWLWISTPSYLVRQDCGIAHIVFMSHYSSYRLSCSCNHRYWSLRDKLEMCCNKLDNTLRSLNYATCWFGQLYKSFLYEASMWRISDDLYIWTCRHSTTEIFGLLLGIKQVEDVVNKVFSAWNMHMRSV